MAAASTKDPSTARPLNPAPTALPESSPKGPSAPGPSAAGPAAAMGGEETPESSSEGGA